MAPNKKPNHQGARQRPRDPELRGARLTTPVTSAVWVLLFGTSRFGVDDARWRSAVADAAADSVSADSLSRDTDKRDQLSRIQSVRLCTGNTTRSSPHDVSFGDGSGSICGSGFLFRFR